MCTRPEAPSKDIVVQMLNSVIDKLRNAKRKVSYVYKNSLEKYLLKFYPLLSRMYFYYNSSLKKKM